MKERIRSIDSNLYTTTQVLLSSDVLDGPHFDLKKAEEILQNEVGKGQSENFFLVRDSAGRILYKYNIQATQFEYIPLEETWHTVNHPEKYIRVLSLKFPKLNDRSLQVGVIINKEFIIPDFFSNVTWLTVLITNGIGMLIAWFLANFLTQPIRRLSEFLNQNAQIENGHFTIDTVSDKKVRYTEKSRDEFDQLIVAINQLIQRVNRGFQISRLWTYQMSHEIKTPLSIINSVVNQNKDTMEEKTSDQIRMQIFKISETINAFLNWAEAQNIRPSVSHFIRISRLMNDLIEKVKMKIQNPVEVELKNDFLIGINYNQMEQVLTNLLINAFNHGNKGKPIRVLCQNNKVTIFNEGPPFPQKIIDNLGQPFNKGDSPDVGLFRGTGLGLAYVATVCQINNYPLTFDHQNGVTAVTLDLTSALADSP